MEEQKYKDRSHAQDKYPPGQNRKSPNTAILFLIVFSFKQ